MWILQLALQYKYTVCSKTLVVCSENNSSHAIINLYPALAHVYVISSWISTYRDSCVHHVPNETHQGKYSGNCRVCYYIRVHSHHCIPDHIHQCLGNGTEIKADQCLQFQGHCPSDTTFKMLKKQFERKET